MFCTACGAENARNARVCVKCGAGLPARCLHCDAELPTAARFCPRCGQPAAVAISSDRLENQDTTHFIAGERKQVTVLFADFAGFTAFTHKQDVEDVRDYLASVWSRLDRIIAEHGGTTEKHIGDALMAVFGAAQAREDDPVQAVRAALAMQSCLADWQPKRGTQPGMRMRIGVHTGLVVVGPVSRSGEFTAIGDTVNLANRLEQNAPSDGVLISQDTYRQVYGFFDVQPLPALTVKGRPDSVSVYVVMRAKPRALAMQLRGVEGVQTPMVGREAELQRLQSEFKSAMQQQEARLVTVVGEAGIGKSCLLREFQRWIELLPQNVRLFWGRARAETAGLPFSLLRDIFSARFEIQESDSPAVAREKLEHGLLELMRAGAPEGAATNVRSEVKPSNEITVKAPLTLALSPSDGGRVVPLGGPGEGIAKAHPFHHANEEPLLRAHFIGQLLGFDYSMSPYLRDIWRDSEQVRQRAFQYLAQFFRQVSLGSSTAQHSNPVAAALLLLEDIHWGDDGSLDFLEFAARACADAPFLIVCLTRPVLFERRAAWAQGPARCARLDLAPLSRRESRALVAAILSKAPELPQALRELIVGSAEGIPFYIEEIIKMLIDQKVIVPAEERWQVEPNLLAAVHVPPTLTGVLQARLDGLSPTERRVLQCASVIGRGFWDSAVERLSSSGKPVSSVAREGPLSRQEVLEALAGLRRKEIIFRREPSAFAGAVEYSFKHDLLRNVAYQGLLMKARRKHHAEAAAWLIEQSGERVNEFAALVALHFEQAGKQTEAAAWFGRAGQQASRGYAPALAIDYFHKAVALAPVAHSEQAEGQAKLLGWYEGLGDVLGAQARFAEGQQAYEKLRELAESFGDNLAQARAWNGLAFLQERLGQNRASLECAQRAEVLARNAANGRAELLRALHLKGWAFYRLGDAAAVLKLADQTLKLCSDFNQRSGLATTYKLYGVAHLQLGHFAEADRFFRQGLEVCQKCDDRRNTAAMFSNLGESARARGDYKAAADLYQQALAIVQQIGHRESEIIYLTNLSAAQLGLRQLVEAETGLRRAVALTSSPNSCALAETYSFLAEACLGQGKFAEALEAGRHGLELAREAENDLYIGSAWRTLGKVAAALKLGSPPTGPSGPESPFEPRACFAESLRIFKQINAEAEQAHTLRAWAEFEFQQPRPEEGRRKGEQARKLFENLGAMPEVERIDALLAGQASSPPVSAPRPEAT